MKTTAQKIRTRWQKLSRWTQITVLTLIALAIAVRAALPYAVKRYVNHQLDKIPNYRGEVADIQIQLIRGAYKIHGLKLEKTTGPIPVPFVSIPEMDLSMQWQELFHGAAVGEIEVTAPEINFVNAPSEDQSQKGENSKDLKETLESLFPFQINRFQVNNGSVRFRDFHRTPRVDIYVTNLFATATNLSNSRETNEKLPSGLIARGRTIGQGELQISLKMNALAEAPTFELAAAVTNMDLVALNNFMQAYGNFDVESGIFQAFSEVAAADGRFEGYVKPFFENLDVFDWDKERKKNILEQFWQALVAGVAVILKNQPRDNVATTIPISGNFEKTDVDMWTTIGGILKNAFVKALLPKIDRTVSVEDAARKDESKNKPEEEQSPARLPSPKEAGAPP